MLVFACGQDDCVEVGVVDEGFHVAEDGVELHPGMLPAAIAADTTVMDVTLLPEVLERWNVWLSRDGVARTVFVVAEEGEEPRAVVGVGYVPASGSDLTGEGDPAGIAALDYAEDGEVLYGEITLSSDYAYDRPTMVQALSHEIGHLVALADDPGPPTTVDLRSVMSSPLDPLGELTRHDFDLLLPYLPE